MVRHRPADVSAAIAISFSRRTLRSTAVLRSPIGRTSSTSRLRPPPRTGAGVLPEPDHCSSAYAGIGEHVRLRSAFTGSDSTSAACNDYAADSGHRIAGARSPSEYATSVFVAGRDFASPMPRCCKSNTMG